MSRCTSRWQTGESYDLLVPSDYMIQRLIEEDLLQKLDKSKLTCMDKLADAVKGLPYDPNNDYSVPYFWGTVGIVYDKNKVDIEDLEREGYNISWMRNTKETYICMILNETPL